MPATVSYLASFISNEEGAGVTVAVDTALNAEDSAEMEDFAEADEETIESGQAVPPRPISIIPISDPQRLC